MGKFDFTPKPVVEPKPRPEPKPTVVKPEVVEPALDNTPEVVSMKVKEEAAAKKAEGTPLTIIKPTLSADEKARDVQEAKVPNKSKLTDEEVRTLANFRVQGTVTQEQALEYHRLLNLLGE